MDFQIPTNPPLRDHPAVQACFTFPSAAKVLVFACFEAVSTSVLKLPVPGSLLREFGQPIEQRMVRYEAMGPGAAGIEGNN